MERSAAVQTCLSAILSREGDRHEIRGACCITSDFASKGPSVVVVFPTFLLPLLNSSLTQLFALSVQLDHHAYQRPPPFISSCGSRLAQAGCSRQWFVLSIMASLNASVCHHSNREYLQTRPTSTVLLCNSHRAHLLLS